MDNCITKFLDLGNVFVEKVENYSNNIVVYVSTESREVVCPQCGHGELYYQVQHPKKKKKFI